MPANAKSERRVRAFFDLDCALLNTHALMDPIVDDLVFCDFPQEAILDARNRAVELGYTFELHLKLLGVPEEKISERARFYYEFLNDRGNQLLYPGVPALIERLFQRGIPCELVTSGVPEFQIAKFKGLTRISSYFTACHFLWKGAPKANTIRARLLEGERGVFTDDSTCWLDHPLLERLTRVRMMWPQNPEARPHPKDGVDWQVARSAEELEQIIIDLSS